MKTLYSFYLSFANFSKKDIYTLPRFNMKHIETLASFLWVLTRRRMQFTFYLHFSRASIGNTIKVWPSTRNSIKLRHLFLVLWRNLMNLWSFFFSFATKPNKIKTPFLVLRRNLMKPWLMFSFVMKLIEAKTPFRFVTKHNEALTLAI